MFHLAEVFKTNKTKINCNSIIIKEKYKMANFKPSPSNLNGRNETNGDSLTWQALEAGPTSNERPSHLNAHSTTTPSIDVTGPQVAVSCDDVGSMGSGNAVALQVTGWQPPRRPTPSHRG
jgi:hypothetical protein